MNTTFQFSGLDVAKDLVFGWCVRTTGEGLEFQLLTDCTIVQLEYLDKLAVPAWVNPEFMETVRKLLEKKSTYLGEETTVPKFTRVSDLTKLEESITAAGGYQADNFNLGYCKVVKQPKGEYWLIGRNTPTKTEVLPTREATLKRILARWW